MTPPAISTLTLALRPIRIIGFFILASLPVIVHAFEMSAIRLGVLAFRPVEQTQSQWAPTANYLEGELGGRPVTVVPLTLETIEQAVAGHQVDFLLANPEQYVLLASRHHLAAVATLMPEVNGRPLSRFGGVVFVRAERGDIAVLQDVAEKSIAAVSDKSFAGFLVQRWTLQQAGVDVMRHRDRERLVLTGLPQDKVVQEVLAGRADVGFVRTGVLEALEHEGKIRPGELRVVNRQPENRFPQALSTELYPEWPLAVMPGVPDAVVKAVTMALYRLPPGHPASRSGGYYGFAPPGDYASVEALLLRLHLHPDRLLHFGFDEVTRKYAVWLIAGVAMIVLGIVMMLLRFATQNRRLLKALARAERLALRDDLLNSLSEGVYGVDVDGICTFINPVALRMLGFSRDEVVGYNQHLLFHHHYPDGREYPYHECPLRQTLDDGRAREVEETFFRKDGNKVLVRLGAQPIWQDGKVVGAVVAFQDISAQKAAEEKIIAMALQDALTGLPNRRLLHDRLETALTRAGRNGSQVAVLFVDLDGFKPINDQFGHDAGDVVLVEVGRRLQSGVRAVDTVGRMGGDEFVLVLADLNSTNDAEAVADKLTRLVEAPVLDGARQYHVSASIGLAIFPQHGRDVETLLRVADRGMYVAKNAGKNCWRWGPRESA